MRNSGIEINRMRWLYYILITILFTNPVFSQTESGLLTPDGAWCWFSDPRAIAFDHYIVAGWVKSDGTIEVAKFDLESKRIQTSELYHQLEKDDHNNPGLVVTQSGKLLALYTRHSREDLFINESLNENGDFTFSEAQSIHPIDSAEFIKFPRKTMTYANPIRLAAEDSKLYCFGRWTGFKPNMMTSTDQGKTWSMAKVFITNYPFDNNNRPYAKYFSDGNSKIHITFTDGHPRNEPNNSVYYAYYEGGAFHKADGTKITDLSSIPFEPKEASTIYKSNEKEGRAWIADIGQTKDDNPAILYTRSPTELNHEYWYAVYHQNKWINHKICDSGKWFPHTPEGEKEREPHYFGGMTIHPANSNIVYLSRKIKGVFEIERWETNDFGKSWKKEAITKNSTHDNVRPFVPRGLEADQKEIVLWMENKQYVHYTTYESSIHYSIREK